MPSPLASTLTEIDALCGWSPTGGDDEDVNVCSDLFFMTIQSLPSSSAAFLTGACPPLRTALSKPCIPSPQLSYSQPKLQPQPSSTITSSAPLLRRSASHSPTAPSSDRRVQRNRNRDPSWIPRPRNAFIIFRCEFSREHTQGSHESQNDDNDDDNATVKTLSKRAAEAWKQLSPSGRERYKILADKEREEHARLYPHYRFRPMKRQASSTSTRKMSSATVESSKGDRAASTECPSAHLPSVLSSAPEKSRSSLCGEREEKPIPVLSIPPPIPPVVELSGFSHNDAQTDASLQLDFNDPLLFSTAMSFGSPPSSADFYVPLPSIPSDNLSFHDFGLDQTNEDPEQTQDRESYAMGIHNFDYLLSPYYSFMLDDC